MTNYYVKNGGNNNNTGLSDAQAWATISQVRNAGLANGSCVYFKCGNTWNTKNDAALRVDWSGIDVNNYAVIGAYYMYGGNEIIGVNSDDKPFFDGGWDTTSDFYTIISPYDVSYVQFQDLELYNSHGMGFAGYQRHPSSYISLIRLRINYTGRCSINFDSCGDGGIIEYCNTSRDNMRWYLKLMKGWGCGIKLRSDNCICRYNEVHEGYGEGINLGVQRATNNLLVENNLVWGMQSYNIYLDGAQNCTIRNNISLGTTHTTYHKPGLSYGGRTWNPMGIGLNSEKANTSLGNKIYNNVCAGCFRGIQLMNLNGSIPSYANRNFIYNNTLIDNYCNSYCHNTQCLTTEFKNNLSIVHNDGVHRVDPNGNGHVWFRTIGLPNCYLPIGNMWSGPGNTDIGDWSHSNDVLGDAKLAKTSGWQNISKPNNIDIAASFALTQGSDAIDSAPNLGSTYANTFIPGSDFNRVDTSNVLTPIVVVTGNQNNYGYRWDFGAFIYTGEVPDLCDGVVCTPVCIGADLWSQRCDPGTGYCIPDQLLEANSITCDYDPCDGVSCPNVCLDDDLWSQRCDSSTGDCILDQLIEANSLTCFYDPCESVSCPNVCVDDDLWSQQCVDGDCVLHQLLQPDSLNCIIPEKIPSDETTILNYILLGGLGLMGLGMLLLGNKNK